jgi:outer membrane protein assembly factor BamC
MNNVTEVNRPPKSLTHVKAPLLTVLSSVLVIALTGCTSITRGDKVDYRAAAAKRDGLEVPPDLTQLSRDTRYQQQAASGSFSAATMQNPSQMIPQANQPVAAGGNDNLRIERLGNDRWLVTTKTPEQVWPVLKDFWAERGFKLAFEQADVGVMETDWAENHANLPQDFVRSTIGTLLDSIYDTGERDKFRTRIERTASGSEIYISHRGMTEVATGSQKDATKWERRPSDPELEAEMLRRLLLKMGAKEEQAQTQVAASVTPQAPRARLVGGPGAATIELDDGFDRAWRRVGISLDRASFTVEDRDRAQGIYFVRYTEGKDGTEEAGFFGRMFSSDKDKTRTLSRYRVQVKSEAGRSRVTVLNAEGGADTGAAASRIASLLVEDLK